MPARRTATPKPGRKKERNPARGGNSPPMNRGCACSHEGVAPCREGERERQTERERESAPEREREKCPHLVLGGLCASLCRGGEAGRCSGVYPRRSCPCLDPVALESPAVAIALKRPLLVPTSGGAILVKGEFADLSPRARPDYCKDFAEQASVRKGTHNITNGPLDIVAELTRKYHGAGRGTRRPQCS